MVVRRVLVLSVAAFAVLASTAQASFHLMKISEVSAGSADDNGDFVELQMFAPGQNFLAGHHLIIYNAAGAVLHDLTLTTVPGPAPSQTTILIGDGAGIAGGISPDIAAPINVPEAGGAVCFPDGSPPDCVAWGTFAGPLPSPVGTNAAALVAGQSLTRSIVPGCATLLESTDDTDSSATDFALTPPSPRPSTVTPTEKACDGGGGGGGGGGDTNPPQTKIDKGPKQKSEKTTAKFKFSSSEQGSKFECKLDKGAFKSCSSPKKYKHLDLGKHKFQVFATDSAGNDDQSPVAYKFKVVEG